MKNDLNHLRIASPCPANWEGMKGDDRVRLCELCNLHVYNIAELTSTEAASLIANAEGRICARIYRRPDNTVITRDCPVGLRAMRRTVAKAAGAVFATLMSLSSVVVGQKPSAKDKSNCRKQVTITKSTSEAAGDNGVMSGTILDPNGAVIPGARVAITLRNTKKSVTSESNNEGNFRISGLLPGSYEVKIESPGFKKLNVIDVKLGAKETVSFEFLLELNAEMVTIGIVGEVPLIDTPGKLVINEKMIQRIPR